MTDSKQWSRFLVTIVYDIVVRNQNLAAKHQGECMVFETEQIQK